jgi:O-antigen ligase
MSEMDLASRDILQRVERFLWAAVLAALPVTSFRYLPFMGADTQVRPLSLIPAVLLLLALGFRCIRERRFLFWSKLFLPLLIFILVAVASSAVGFLLAPANLYSFTYSSRDLRAWLSLGVGLVFLLTSMCMNRNEQDLKFTIKWIYVGLILEVAWSLVQFFEIYIHHFDLLDSIQKMVMMAGLPPNGRISGLALEPSWLAAQVMTFYLPWAFAGLVKNYNWGGRRFFGVLILGASAFLLIYSFSRGGILIAIATIILTLIIAGGDRIRQALNWFVSPLRRMSLSSGRLLDVGLRIIVMLTVIAGLAGGIFILSRNQYFAQLWQTNQGNLVSYFVSIYAGPRLAYAWAGWTIFAQHPWTGVGLGAAGLYMIKALPDWAHFNIAEIAQLLSPDNTVFPNVNNLYVRLLAETGILGFWSFISFYLLLLDKILNLLVSKRKELAYLAVASLLAWLSIVLLGFTLDSFAMSTIWLPLGVLIGMAASRD